MRRRKIPKGFLWVVGIACAVFTLMAAAIVAVVVVLPDKKADQPVAPQQPTPPATPLQSTPAPTESSSGATPTVPPVDRTRQAAVAAAFTATDRLTCSQLMTPNRRRETVRTFVAHRQQRARLAYYEAMAPAVADSLHLELLPAGTVQEADCTVRPLAFRLVAYRAQPRRSATVDIFTTTYFPIAVEDQASGQVGKMVVPIAGLSRVKLIWESGSWKYQSADRVPNAPRTPVGQLPLDQKVYTQFLTKMNYQEWRDEA